MTFPPACQPSSRVGGAGLRLSASAIGTGPLCGLGASTGMAEGSGSAVALEEIGDDEMREQV